jgi:acyl-coenzyme A thioesterase PaaI-like protein
MRGLPTRYRHHMFGAQSGEGDGRRSRAVGLFTGGIVVAAVAAAITIPAAAASATSSPTYWVSPSGVSTGADTSCATAAYSTVQSAVTAAQEAETGRSVPTIKLCSGTYTEQVTISKSLNFVRASGAVTIELPASPVNSTTTCQTKDAATSTEVPQSVIEICAANASGANTRGVAVSISHVTIEGEWPNSVCDDSLYDVLVEGGASLSLADSVVTQAGAYPLNGCQGGVGVEAGFSPTGQIGHAVLVNDTINNYQKNGITIDGADSTGYISGVTVSGDGPTNQIAQNGIQISFGATGTITHSTITGNNYTGTGEAFATGVLVVGGGGKVCGNGVSSNPGLVRYATVTRNTLINNDVGVALFNINSKCNASVHIPTDDVACYNDIRNSHGYQGGPSADANISGFETKKYGAIGDQAGISDTGSHDLICHNAISGVGYGGRDSRSELPNPKPPAWVRPIDIFSFAAAYHPVVKANSYDGKPYIPH